MNFDPKIANQDSSADQSLDKAELQFILLSAYLDQEATPAEKLQVEHWLATDVKFRHLQQQQLKLRQHLINLPTPVPSDSRQVVDRVMAKIEQRSQFRKLFLGGGIALAAAVIGVIGSVFTINSPSAQFATNSIPTPSATTGKEKIVASQSATQSVQADYPQADERVEISIESPIIAMSK